MAAERHTVDDAVELYRADEKAVRGTLAPFVPTFRDEANTRPYGWVCEHCGGDDVAADTLGRVVCNDCHNASAPTTWDSGYL
jgi:hypothetical protein